MSRVVVYIDGLNLYYGVRARLGRSALWLDVERLATTLLRPHQRVVGVDYFTARVRNAPAGELRQSTYLSALRVQCRHLVIIEGRFQERTHVCRACGQSRITYDEKETDVNIASGLIRDTVRDRFDIAVLISADADLAPAVATAKALDPRKRFTVGLPPRRHSDGLRRACDSAFFIPVDKIRAAQLPERIVLPSGVVLERPAYWR